MLKVGTTVGSYRVARFLGAGGMGSVYEVTHTAMPTRHALKVLGDQYMRSPGVRERFRREAELMFTLGTHPHIVRATDVLEDEELMALVIDYVDGGDLGEALDQRPGGLPWAEAWRILGPIVSAVAFAHERNVVHRDLKPENVLLRRDGPWPGVPVVADFGIAKVIGSESATRTQARMGTACYGAPEQFKNAKEVGAQADVWSLGMLAYRLVTGSLPVDPEDNVALIKLYEGLVPVPRLEGVPEHVAVAVAAALQADPTQRPFNAGVLQKLLTAEAAIQRPGLHAPLQGSATASAAARAPVPTAGAGRGLWLGLSVGVATSTLLALAVVYSDPAPVSAPTTTAQSLATSPMQDATATPPPPAAAAVARAAEPAAHANTEVIAEALAKVREAVAGQRWDEALRQLEAVTALDKGHAEALALREAVNREREVGTKLDLADNARKDEDPTTAWFTLEELGPVDEASFYAGRARAMREALRPEVLAGYLAQAKVFLDGKQYAEAIQKGELALALQADHAEARELVARAKKARGEAGKGDKESEKPPAAAAAQSGDELYDEAKRHHNSDPAKALGLYQQAATKGKVAAWKHIGSLRSKKGDRAGAIAAYQKYLELVPGASDAETVRDVLKQWRGQ
jgi:serine/threonine protein kinase